MRFFDGDIAHLGETFNRKMTGTLKRQRGPSSSPRTASMDQGRRFTEAVLGGRVPPGVIGVDAEGRG